MNEHKRSPISLDSQAILNQLPWGEGADLEFKSAKGGLPRSLWETYSAMANTHGGVILLGVEDNGTVSGITNPAHLKKNFWDIINNYGKVSINLLANTDMAEIAHPSGVILAIRVPRATRYQRPVFLGQNPLTGTYRRNHESDYHCTEQEVSRMLSDRAEEPADSRILEGFGMSDIDPVTLQQYRQRLASHKPDHPWLNADDQELLTKLGGWRQDRKTEMKGLTMAGVLMFGREEVIREGVPSYHVDYREKLSDDPASRWTDRLTMDGTWHANLFQFYSRAVHRLTADLRLPFLLDSALFRKGETIVHEAIREALVNTLIHADHLGQGGIVVEKYPNRFLFSNPGGLLVSLEQLLRGNVSECRNKALQTMFMMIGIAEKAGSGVDKIFYGWKTQRWSTPSVNEQMQPNRISWLLPMVPMETDDSVHKEADSVH
ncbi:MAG: putative DNA binding domain-containing protein, partial [Magnetococcales bacterium]|nr:putative DNA binding domain-containing protein [Magnetococcales bacterium]